MIKFQADKASLYESEDELWKMRSTDWWFHFLLQAQRSLASGDEWRDLTFPSSEQMPTCSPLSSRLIWLIFTELCGDTISRHRFLKRWASIIVDGQMLLADILPQLSEMPGKRKKGNGCMVPYVSMHRECINTENVRGPSAADAFKFRALKIKGSTKWHKLQQMLL